MSIVKLRKKLDDIRLMRIAQSKEGDKEIQRMGWQLEQLTGQEQIDSLADIKRRMKEARKEKERKK